MKEQKQSLKHSKQTHHSKYLAFLVQHVFLCNDGILLVIENKIGREGVKAIAEALKTNTLITEICLDNMLLIHMHHYIIILYVILFMNQF